MVTIFVSVLFEPASNGPTRNTIVNLLDTPVA